MAGGYISPQGAQNLGSYSYSGVDKSLLAHYVMRHYWNWLIDHVVPPYIAPNVLTLCGLLCVLGGYLLLAAYVPGMEGVAPNWVYFVIGVLFFAYSTFDNLDGKQARKTGTSSALGEVFDHGGDAIATPLFVITVGATVQFGPWLTYYSVLMLVTVFYLAHWESYFTGTLLLRPLSNPTEANTICVLSLFWTAIKGPNFWTERVAVLFLGEYEWRTIYFFFSFIGFCTTVLDHATTVAKFMRSRSTPIRPAVLFLLPFCLFMILTYIWASATPTVLEDRPRIFLSTVGLVFSYLAIRLIVQQVCKEPFKLYYNVLTPLLLVTLNSVISALAGAPIFSEMLILTIYFFTILCNVAYMVVVLISEFCYYLTIRPFTISKPTPVVADVPIQLNQV